MTQKITLLGKESFKQNKKGAGTSFKIIEAGMLDYIKKQEGEWFGRCFLFMRFQHMYPWYTLTLMLLSNTVNV